MGPGYYSPPPSKNWYCNCKPRLPAAFLQVRSDISSNKGRWFYACSAENDLRCRFFLWADEARMREADSDSPRNLSAATREISTSDKGKVQSPPKSSPKRAITPSAESTSESEGESPFFATPHKDTPFRENHKSDPFATPTAHEVQTATPPTTHHSSPPPPFFLSPVKPSLHDILRRIKDPQLASELCNLTSRQERVSQGIIKGRDAARAALKERDDRILSLTARIQTLEAEVESRKTINRALEREKEVAFTLLKAQNQVRH
ncbi:hypothetical protein NEOLI_002331 [Neolecta irregularis DAH-3]|uniref:GRF-type domain-containing protein n=1 Tax=Neolecta irregularis (strain DAH-3) TaxID=1198029 RepID=A0A1U7LV24_NEOID|nr:hypothetical protein NEOLI_002331 [Neolecta irregularis DAH-3]|eukprot:OLL26494.1 hypothetical protein NEOLI_002331 [Neolecta irregularis DAH-3]